MKLDGKFPPDGYVPTRSAMEGVVVYMPAPDIDDYETLVQFDCPQCGGTQAYNVRQGGLSCKFCGYYVPAKKSAANFKATENEFRTEASEKRKQDRLNRQLGIPSDAESNPATSSPTDKRKPSEEESTSHHTPSTLDQLPTTDDYDWGVDRQQLECDTCGATVLLDAKALTYTCPFCGSSKVIQHVFARDKLRPHYLFPFKVDDESAVNKISNDVFVFID